MLNSAELLSLCSSFPLSPVTAPHAGGVWLPRTTALCTGCTVQSCGELANSQARQHPGLSTSTSGVGLRQCCGSFPAESSARHEGLVSEKPLRGASAIPMGVEAYFFHHTRQKSYKQMQTCVCRNTLSVHVYTPVCGVALRQVSGLYKTVQ